VEIAVEPARGAAGVLLRGGDDRDLASLADIHARRAPRYRFALDRTGGWMQYVITKRRLLAGLLPDGQRSVEFFCVEEGSRAVAYTLSVVAETGCSLEDAGDRDPEGVRFGAALQVLAARDPACRPTPTFAWLPPDLYAPQLTIAARYPSREVMMLCGLNGTTVPRLTCDDVLYPHSDVF
jgi:hypothetical protein